MFHCATCGFSPQAPHRATTCHCGGGSPVAHGPNAVLVKHHSRWTLRDLVSFTSMAAVGLSSVYLVLARMA